MIFFFDLNFFKLLSLKFIRRSIYFEMRNDSVIVWRGVYIIKIGFCLMFYFIIEKLIIIIFNFIGK